ncbi:MAG TPA: biotin--[acetyl-CoA-carboxylase] ligase [Spartobacteria bacterium]|nr:biotin--[acetyl-CoA-carboxylase] ligase [Spartobacteria bacterium]HCP91171.1 biotin--[acetyl-CoA-carboxylase] ligase [Spartobacteria bacterium]
MRTPKIDKSAATDRLVADELRDALGVCTIGREIVVLEETASTNDSVLQRATFDTPEGLVVFAERQTAGRGQRGNTWESAAHKGLWFSILLRPKIDIGDSGRLTAWAAEAIAQTIAKEFALSATIKPPNDIYIAGKKIAGVLVEMRAQQNAPHVAISGIGINMNHRLEDFSKELRSRAISLAMVLDRQVDRQQLAIALLRNLDRTYVETFGS